MCLCSAFSIFLHLFPPCSQTAFDLLAGKGCVASFFAWSLWQPGGSLIRLHLFVHTLIVIFWYGRGRTQHLEPCPGIMLPQSNWSMHRRCFLPKKNWEEWRYYAVWHKISYVIKVFNHHCTAPLPGPMAVHFEARLRRFLSHRANGRRTQEIGRGA